MKHYKFHIGYPPNGLNMNKNIEEYLEQMQNRGWEFIGLTPIRVSGGYTNNPQGYIFRREDTICTPEGDNNKY